MAAISVNVGRQSSSVWGKELRLKCLPAQSCWINSRQNYIQNLHSPLSDPHLISHIWMRRNSTIKPCSWPSDQVKEVVFSIMPAAHSVSANSLSFSFRWSRRSHRSNWILREHQSSPKHAAKICTHHMSKTEAELESCDDCLQQFLWWQLCASIF